MDEGRLQDRAAEGEVAREFAGATPTHDLARWRWLWREDRTFPVASHRRWLGPVVVFLKRLLRPAVQAPQADLWDRQRTFNLVLLAHVEDLEANFDRLGQDLQQVQREIVGDLRSVQSDYIRDMRVAGERLDHLDEFLREGIDEICRHSDALFARLDQKLDRLRRQAAETRGRLEEAGAGGGSD